ncbi:MULTISPECIES: DoxX family protein [unclassified Arthrobacter]|uniref:DoxX family protein n=1 Tax=unclassified Arthrobacter TaxID=235627 RepID=UPI0002FA7C9A|nr:MULTISPECIES: DoxX family protein [unclassified Arthrobacter]PVE18799.1 DoxX family protein [Arthrobacter sp. Bz4]
MQTNRMELVWVALAAVLAFFFVRAGIEKVMGDPAALLPFQESGLPGWTVYLTAAGEFIGSAALFVPRVRTPGALLLVLVMTGAAVTNIVNGDVGYLWTNVLLGAGAMVLAWQGRSHLLNPLRRDNRPG